MISAIIITILALLLAFFVWAFWLRGKTIDSLAESSNDLIADLASQLADAKRRGDDYRDLYYANLHNEPTPEELKETYRSLGLE